jgi:ribosomal protein L40E
MLVIIALTILLYAAVGVYTGAWVAARYKRILRKVGVYQLGEDEQFGVAIAFFLWPLAGLYWIGVSLSESMAEEKPKFKKCKDCDAENLPEATYCKLCGHLMTL